MNRRTTAIFGGRRAGYQRALSYLLLLLVTYAVTVEMAQSHGPVASRRATVAATPGGVVESQSSDTSRSHNAQCPMCQFQAQLCSSLVHPPLLALTLSIQNAFVSTQTDVHLSTAAVPTSDRAPPRG
jgi:hypothetical protein